MHYDRKIKYLEDMRNGERVRGAGFVKMEVRDSRCRINIQVRGLHETDSFEKPVLLVHGGKEGLLCRIKLVGGRGDTGELCLDSMHLGENRISYEELEEIRIPIAAGRELRCIWREQSPDGNTGTERTAKPEEAVKTKKTAKSGEAAMMKKTAGLREDAGTEETGAGAEENAQAEEVTEMGRAVHGEGIVKENKLIERKETAREEGIAREEEGTNRAEIAGGEEAANRQGIIKRREIARGEGIIKGAESIKAEAIIKAEGIVIAEEGLKETESLKERQSLKGTENPKAERTTKATGKIVKFETIEPTKADQAVHRETPADTEAAIIADEVTGRVSTDKTNAEGANTGSAPKEAVLFPLEDKWRQLSAVYPHIAPFGDEREYLSLDPGNFVIFPSRYYRLVNNSFLLHGYHNYEHLILTRIEYRGEVRYYIGVPGNYYEKEKQVALMFGFESFESKREPAQPGDYGYYMMRVEL